MGAVDVARTVIDPGPGTDKSASPIFACHGHRHVTVRLEMTQICHVPAHGHRSDRGRHADDCRLVRTRLGGRRGRKDGCGTPPPAAPPPRPAWRGLGHPSEGQHSESQSKKNPG